MISQVEEGELPEEGEIMEEDDDIEISENKTTVQINSTESKKNYVPITSTSVTNKKTSAFRYKDFDAKNLSKDEIFQNRVTTSWVDGTNQNIRLNINELKKNIVTDNFNKKNDKDFRQLTSAEGEIFDDDENEENKKFKSNLLNSEFTLLKEENEKSEDNQKFFHEEDSDFRQQIHEGLINRRRLNEVVEGTSVKRQRTCFNSNTSVEEECSPESSPPQFLNKNAYLMSDGFRNTIRNRSTITFSNNASNNKQQQNSNERRWGERTICKFFREGFCRDGDDCSFSHNASDSHRKPELCKFYQHGFCKKGLACQHLHGEYPCKAYHKGECSKEQCQYSHQGLDEFTQPIFDQIMKDEELASRISLPTHPLKRKVLIPQGPEPTTDFDHNSSSNAVVPVLSSMPAAQEEKVMAATGTYGFFNPITPINISTVSGHQTSVSQSSNQLSKISLTLPNLVIPPPISTSTASTSVSLVPTLGAFAAPLTSKQSRFSPLSQKIQPLNLFPALPLVTTTANTLQTPNFKLPQFSLPSPSIPFLKKSSSSPKAVVSSCTKREESNFTKTDEATEKLLLRNNSTINNKDDDLNLNDGGFNINLMLEKITQQVTGPSSNLLEDSPASPPHIFSDIINNSTTKLIPVVRNWKLIPVEVDVSEEIAVDLKLIGQISSGSYRNDPRLRKLAEKQFDLVTKTLEKQSVVSNAIKSESNESNLSGINNFKDQKDPRKLADPRKKAAQYVKNSAESLNENLKPNFSSDDVFQNMIQRQLQMVNQMNSSNMPSTSAMNMEDIDHRSTYGLNLTRENSLSNQIMGTQNNKFVNGSAIQNSKNFETVDMAHTGFDSLNFVDIYAESELSQKKNQQNRENLNNSGSFFNNNCNEGIEEREFSTNFRKFNNYQGTNNISETINNPFSKWNETQKDNLKLSSVKVGNQIGGQYNYQRQEGTINKGYFNNFRCENQNNTSNYHNENQLSEVKKTNKNAIKSLPRTNDQQQKSLPLQPVVSLREKRKNNEYESPLARISTKY